MSYKSVIDIDVNDEKFSEFLSKFEKFKKDTKDIPEPFQKMDKKISAAREGFSKLGGHLKRHMREGTGATKDFTVELHHAGRRMATLTARVSQGRKELSQMGETGRKTFGIIARAGKDLFKAIPFVGGAVAGAGLAAVALYQHQSNAILNRYKNAKFLGMKPGQVSAIDTQYQGVLANPAQSLAAMRQAEFVPSAQSYFARAIGPDYQHMGKTQLFDEALRKAKTLADHTRTNLLGIMDTVRGFSQIGISTQDLAILKRTSWATLNADIANAHKQAAAMSFSKQTGRDMTKLAITISQKEVELSTDLSRTLAKGAPLMNTALNRLVNSVNWAANRINAALKGVVTGKAPTKGQGVVLDAAGKVYNGLRSESWYKMNAQTAQDQAWEYKKIMSLLPKGTWLYRREQKAYQMELNAEKRYLAEANRSAIPQYERNHNPMDILAFKGDSSYLNNGNGIRYARFASNAQDYRAAARLVQGYPVPHTVLAETRHFEGYVSHNPTAKQSANNAVIDQHAANIAKSMKVGENQALNLGNVSVLARLITGLRENEQPMQRSDHQLYSVIKRALIDSHRETSSGTPAHNIGAQLHMAAH